MTDDIVQKYMVERGLCDDCKEKSEEEREKDDPSSTAIARIMDTKRKLIDNQLENQSRYLEFQSDSPQELIKELEKILAQGAMTKETRRKLVRALERDLGYRRED